MVISSVEGVFSALICGNCSTRTLGQRPLSSHEWGIACSSMPPQRWKISFG